MDFENAKEVLEELESEYPDCLYESKLKSKISFSNDEFDPIREYLTAQSHIRVFVESDDNERKFKITTEGIDFLEERRKSEIESKRNYWHKWSTVAIAAFTFLALLNGVTTSSHDINPVVDNHFNCPNPQDSSWFDFKYSNGGASSGHISWKLTGENVTIDSRNNYDLDQTIDLSAGGQVNPKYSLQFNESAESAILHYKVKTELFFPFSVLNIKGVMNEETCEYQNFETDDIWSDEWRLING